MDVFEDLPPLTRQAKAEPKVWTLTFDERDGRLTTMPAQWLQTQCRGIVDRDHGGWAEWPIKVRLQRNVTTGEVLLLPSIEEGIVVRTHRTSNLPVRFYAKRLLRGGLVKPKQVVKLRVVGDRLVLVGVRAPV
jgi:hypothetical protein